MSLYENGEKIVKDIQSTDDLNLYCISLSEDVMAGKLSIAKVVEWLGPLLTDTKVVEREKGTCSLSYLLVGLKTDFLSATELTLLTAFYCDRMKDHHTLSNAILQGILAIVKMDNLPSDSPKLISTSIFTHMHCQTLLQPERNWMYQIFQYLIAYKVEDLKDINIDFVLGFITAIDGERDPNNLMLLFSILPKFLTSFPLGHLTEEAFSVVSCYFPIDFNPAADETKSITREDLALGLTPCLVAIPEFAEFCIPLALEKLDSNRRIAKLDSFTVLKEGCANSWTAANVEPHLIQMWVVLKRELIPGSTDLEVRATAAATLTELLKLLYRQRPNLLAKFLDDILSSTSGLLSDTHLSLYSPAVDLLEIAARSSPAASEKIISYVVPKLCFYEKRDTPEDAMIVIMNTLITFVKASLEHSTKFDITHDYWRKLPEMLCTATSNTTNSHVQLSAYNGLITLAPYLTAEQRAAVYNGCGNSLQQGSEQVRRKCIDLLKRLARIHPSEIMECVVDSKLKNNRDKGLNVDINDWQVEALCGLAVLPDFVNTVCELLLGLIEQGSPSVPMILRCLRNLLESPELLEETEERNGVLEVFCRLYVKRLVLWWLEAFQQADNGQRPNSCLIDLAAVVESLIKVQSSSLQAEVTSPLIEAIVLTQGKGDCRLSKNSKQKFTVVLLEALLSSLHPDVHIHNWLSLATSLTEIAFTESDLVAQQSASRLLAILINKLQNDEQLAALLGHIAKGLEQRLRSRDAKSKLNAIKLLAWVTKALVLRGHGLMAYWIDKLTDQLADEGELGKEAADGFRLLMAEDKLYSVAKSNCTFRIFYRQRFFQRAPALASTSRTCPRSSKLNYLTALAHLVQSVPRPVLIPSLRQVMLPMVESLDEGEGSLELTILGTLSGLLAEQEPALQAYTDTFIPRFLKLAKESPHMQVRISALECLKYYASYPSVQMVPYVDEVTSELQPCLDDKKRLVRFAAVNARSAWFLINYNSEDAE